MHHYVKRLFDVEPILRALKHRGIPVVITLVGEGPDLQMLLSRASDLVASGELVSMGRRPPEQILSILTQQHVFLSTSEEEGGPRTLIEAMGSGAIPVVSDIPGYSKECVYSGSTGFRVRVCDIAGFVDAISRLHQIGLQAEAISAQCVLFAKAGFGLSAMTQRYSHFLNRLIEEPAKRTTDPKFRSATQMLGRAKLQWAPGWVRKTIRRLHWTTSGSEGISARP